MTFFKQPRAAQQAQGPQREELKKQLGEFRSLPSVPGKIWLDREDLTRLQILLTRQALAGAYLGDLRKMRISWSPTEMSNSITKTIPPISTRFASVTS